MKKIVLLAVFALGLSSLNAQVSFKPGLRAGLNFAKITQTESTSKTDFYIAGFGELKLTKYYTLQPEISYSNQGAKNINLGYYDYNSSSYVIEEKDFSVSYISFAVINKFTFNDTFNFHLGPTIDFQSGKNVYTNSDVDLAFMFGLGYNVTPNLAIEGRVKKGIVDVLDSDYQHSSSATSGSYNTNFLFQLGLSYTFDVK